MIKSSLILSRPDLIILEILLGEIENSSENPNENNIDIEEVGMEEKLIEIKKEISKLGYVNMSAIEDIKDLSARYEEMTKEMDDDKKAEEDLLQIIK